MKRELMEACDTTTADSPSPMADKRPRRDFERRPVKTERLEQISNTAQPFQARQQSAVKRRALDRNFATKLVSITLTSGDLHRLNAVFGGADDVEQLEQFGHAVSGCLCRLRRHAVDQPNEVIALIGAVVGPVDLHQVAFPRRRLFIFPLGYFEFDQLTDQKPDLVDYGPWMADMDIQSMPLPSDEFIDAKAQMLQSLLADSAHHHNQQQHQHVERVHHQQQHQRQNWYDANTADGCGDDDDDVRVLELDTASSTVKTEVSDGRDIDEGDQAGDSGDEQLEHDDDEEEEDEPDRDGGHNNNMANANEPPVSRMVYCTRTLHRVRFPLSKLSPVQDLGQICDYLVGCLVVCGAKGNKAKTVIIDEIIQMDGDRLMFKHSPSTYYQLTELVDYTVTDKLFRQWIDTLTEWGEQLPMSSMYRQRRNALYDRLRVLKRTQKMSRNQRRQQRRREKQERALLEQCSSGSSSSSSQPPKTSKRAPSARIRQQQQKQRGAKPPQPAAATTVATHPPPPALPQHQQQYDDAFIEQFSKIFVHSRHLVHLMKLGQGPFERVAIGLYVKQRYSSWVEPITRVTWGAKPYSMFGTELHAVLHFEHGHRCTIKALDSDIPSSRSKMEFVRTHLFSAPQQQQMMTRFEPPTFEHVQRKGQQFRDAQHRTKLMGRPSMGGDDTLNF